MTTKTRYVAALTGTLLASSAVAQKTDRLPAEPDRPKVVRTIAIGADGQMLPFAGRWEPVDALPVNRPSGKAVTTQNIPVTAAAPLPTPRPAVKVADLCTRHGLRKVTTRGGRSWRCR